MRGVELPIARAAVTNSRFASCNVALRVTIANRSQSRSPIATISTVSELPTSATTTSATSTTGSVRRWSG